MRNQRESRLVGFLSAGCSPRPQHRLLFIAGLDLVKETLDFRVYVGRKVYSIQEEGPLGHNAVSLHFSDILVSSVRKLGVLGLGRAFHALTRRKLNADRIELRERIREVNRIFTVSVSKGVLPFYLEEVGGHHEAFSCWRGIVWDLNIEMGRRCRPIPAPRSA